VAETPDPLDPDLLYRPVPADRFDFETTDDLEPLDGVVGQSRAARAIRFGIGMDGDGFNVYALGPADTDKQTLVRHFVEERASGEEVPPDLCYVNNFEEPHRPRAIQLPAGVGCEWAEDMDRVLEELRPALRAAFESEEYQTRKQAVQEEVGEDQQEAFEQLQEEARERGLALVRTPAGFVFAPLDDGEVVSPDKMDEFPEEKQERLQRDIEELQQRLQRILQQVPGRQREARKRIQELNREVAKYALRDLLEELRNKYSDYPEIRRHLNEVQEHVVQNVRDFLSDDQQMPGGGGGMGGPVSRVGEQPMLRRYRVNVLVDHEEEEHAPVVYEDNPTYQNLVGRVEYLPQMGALVTDFNFIRPGALHRANGGYLLLDVRQVLLQPLAWEALKRTLESGEIRIESAREAMGLVSTVTLEPEPVELDVKVVLLGDRLLYYLLSEYDPDFGDLFKVQADFDDRMDRTPENEELYAGLVTGLVRKEGLRPFHASAVGRIIERSARMVGDAEKLSVRSRGVLDLIRESHFWAGEDGADVVTAEHVQQAVDERIHRSDRLRERVQEEIERGTIFIDTRGSEPGQINGLAVLQLGDFAFGRPNRITARVRLGKGEVVDIEREVELGGPIHSKGVMILSGFLGARYASDRPLSLSASLVFEQSYSGIEGDSASSAELYALLSAIADVPLRQSLAVTGSVNQYGEVQPIGGVNEKIEGFFDVCRRQGLTGEQGVLIPAANVKHLMLRDDVRDAVREGDFHVHPVEHVDQGMELLTGMEMGERDDEGRFPEGSVNARVEARLEALAETRLEYGRDGEE
jgi:lon-related putative ATP-dependent protease